MVRKRVERGYQLELCNLPSEAKGAQEFRLLFFAAGSTHDQKIVVVEA